MEKINHKVNIAGTSLKVVSDDSPEYMAALSKQVDLKIAKILKNGSLSTTQAAVIAALEYADMLKKSDSSTDTIKLQLKESLKDVAAARKEADFYKRELERLQGTKKEEDDKNPALW